MHSYELTIVLPEKATPAKQKAIREKLEKVISVMKGKMDKVEEWGKIDLAYPIGKNETGTFVHYPLELEAEAARQLDNRLRIDEDIIRYLLIKKN